MGILACRGGKGGIWGKALKLFGGIRRRWFVSCVVVTLVLVTVGVLAYSISVSAYYYSGMEAGLKSRAKTASNFFVSYVTKTYAEYYQSVYKYTESFEARDKMELQFIDVDGEVLISTYGITAGTSPGTPDIGTAIATGQVSVWRGRSPETGERILTVSSPLIYSDGQTIGVMRYVTSLQLVDEQVFKSVLTALGIGVAFLLMMILSNLYFIQTIVGPVSQLTAMAGRISEGSYGIQLDKKYNDEIGALTDAVNTMSMKINQTEKMKTEFISSVSHELRTPLTAITGWGETLLYDEGLKEDQRKGLEIILSEARRLTKLVEELLEFTRMEDGRFTVNVRQIDIADQLEDVVYTYGEYLHHNGIVLDYQSPDGKLPMIAGDPERLKQVFFNILDNAAKHGGEGGKIQVAIGLEHDDVVIRIRDHGPGIPDDEIENVKMKFYKGSSKARGTGIGLAVCEEIVNYHDGRLELENVRDGGLLVTIRLPVG